ncbi:MAG: hypothetical protein ACXWLH_04300 [Candidatus Saccharimonadales bacterium]
MKHKIMTALTVIMLAFSIAPVASMAIASAATPCPSGSDPAGQVIGGIKQTGNDCSTSGVSNLLSTIVGIISFVAGAAAVIMVILAGFKYITSGGDSAKIGSAKGTLIYALVGVAIAVLAQILVHFVINTTIHATS